MAEPLRILCSMATRGLLAELAGAWNENPVSVQAVGGVDAARRVRAGAAVDGVVLAAAPMRALEAEGFIVPGSQVPIVASAIAVAVRENEAAPDLANADGVRRAVLAAKRTGYSSGPSGDHLLRLLDGWNLRGTLGDRLVQAPPGMPVGQLLAEGAVDLAFQQRSELLGLPGIVIAGMLPPAIQGETVFTAGIARTTTGADAVRRFIGFLASAATSEAKRRHGLEPAQESA